MLMTAAPCAIARLMPVTESAQRISSGSGTLSARMPGQTPRMPTSFFGAEATAAVSVPWAEATGSPPRVERLPPANSGWAASSWESTSASSGLGGVTGGGTSAGSTIAARQPAAVERVGRRAPACGGRAGWARRRGAARGRAAPGRARARGPARRHRRPCRRGARRGRRRARRRRGPAARRRSRSRGPRARRPRAASPGSVTVGRSGAADAPAGASHGRHDDGEEKAARHPSHCRPRSRAGRRPRAAPAAPRASARVAAQRGAGPHRAQQRGRGAVALLAVLLAEARRARRAPCRARSRRPTRAGRAGG